MQGTWNNCDIWGGHLSEIIANCFRPDIDLYIFRDAYPEEEVIYSGEASNAPNLQGKKVIELWYDAYKYVLFIEVK